MYLNAKENIGMASKKSVPNYATLITATYAALKLLGGQAKMMKLMRKRQKFLNYQIAF